MCHREARHIVSPKQDRVIQFALCFLKLKLKEYLSSVCKFYSTWPIFHYHDIEIYGFILQQAMVQKRDHNEEMCFGNSIALRSQTSDKVYETRNIFCAVSYCYCHQA